MTKSGDVPQWMLCEDMITKIKDELILEAIDILHEEVKAGRIDMIGYVPLLPDRPSEIQRDMYMINNLRLREAEIMEQYRPYLGVTHITEPEKLKWLEDFKKFALSVGAISTLMRFSEVAQLWAEDTGRYSKLDDPVQILSKTMKIAAERTEVLEFALSSAKFIKSESLSGKEIVILKKVLEKSFG